MQLFVLYGKCFILCVWLSESHLVMLHLYCIVMLCFVLAKCIYQQLYVTKGLDQLLILSSQYHPIQTETAGENTEESGKNGVRQDIDDNEDDMDLTCIGNQHSNVSAYHQTKLTLSSGNQQLLLSPLSLPDAACLGPDPSFFNSDLDITCDKVMSPVTFNRTIGSNEMMVSAGQYGEIKPEEASANKTSSCTKSLSYGSSTNMAAYLVLCGDEKYNSSKGNVFCKDSQTAGHLSAILRPSSEKSFQMSVCGEMAGIGSSKLQENKQHPLPLTKGHSCTSCPDLSSKNRNLCIKANEISSSSNQNTYTVKMNSESTATNSFLSSAGESSSLLSKQCLEMPDLLLETSDELVDHDTNVLVNEKEKENNKTKEKGQTVQQKEVAEDTKQCQGTVSDSFLSSDDETNSLLNRQSLEMAGLLLEMSEERIDRTADVLEKETDEKGQTLQLRDMGGNEKQDQETKIDCEGVTIIDKESNDAWSQCQQQEQQQQFVLEVKTEMQSLTSSSYKCHETKSLSSSNIDLNNEASPQVLVIPKTQRLPTFLDWLEYVKDLVTDSQRVLPWKLKLSCCDANHLVFSYPHLKLTVGLSPSTAIVADIPSSRHITSTEFEVISEHVNCFTQFMYGLVQQSSSLHAYSSLQHITELLNDVGLMVRQAQAVGCLLWEMSMKHLVVAKAEISALLMEWHCYNPPYVCSALFTLCFHHSRLRIEVSNRHIRVGMLTDQKMEALTGAAMKHIGHIAETVCK
ncbi:uncharacterized protein LOC134191094 isoform X2 [Corticium candelabrum]|uniref:uncharacterized protein LOC134191094 isoform X2 n=1 Tax=Corticium candelabrum TaxID=121492 RepID=UPI002E26EBE7|nr:uncharacterized protein LOC134191094 isoform X2 [Corticium candelabrum]